MQYTSAGVRPTGPVLRADAIRYAAVLLDAERQRLVLFLPVVMGAGVACYFGWRTEPPLWPVAAAASAFALLALTIRRVAGGRAAAIAGLAFTLGLIAPMLQTRRVLPPLALPRHAVIVEGVVRAIDALPDGGARLTIDHPALDGGAPAPRTIRIRRRANDTVPISDGDTIRIRALLRPPANPAYPGAWDLQRDAFFSGLAGSGFALGAVQHFRAHAPPQGVRAWWQGLRDHIAQRLETALPGPRGAIAATLMAGRSTAIPLDDRAAFTNSGLAHLLAVAGLHIGIVMGLVMGAVRNGLACWPYAALRWPTRQVAAIAALAAGGLYLLLTGAHLPIIRSFCMAALATLGIVIGRRALSMRGLAVAATIVLAIWPNEITGVSFQMSFAAVAALIAGYEVLRPLFAHAANGGVGRRFGLHVAALALTSVLAGTASAPYAAYHFGQIQLYFVLANVLAVPLTAIWVMPCGIAALALMPFGLDALAETPMGWGIGAILWIGRTVAGLPAATLSVPHMPLDGLLALSLGIALLCLLRGRLRLAGIAFILAGIASPLAASPPDILVSDDARLIAIDQDRTLFIARRPGASKFTIEADQHYWATRGEPALLPTGARRGAIDCDPVSCRLSRAGRMVLLPLKEGAPDCAGATLIVSAFPLRDACDGTPRIDRFSVWRDGAASAWLTPRGVDILTDRQWRGARPWVPPLPAPRPKARPTLPAAMAE